MKEEVIIRILDQASAFLNREQIQKLKFVIEVELQHCSITQEETALAIRHNLPNRIGLFLASKKVDGMSPKTLKNYYLILNRFGQAVPKDIEQISDIDIRMYLAHYSQRGIKNSTLGTTVTALKSFFTWLKDQEYINKSPMRNIKQTKPEKRVRKSLSDEELELLRCACNTEREKSIIEFFYSTGCRLDEVVKLNKEDINWINKSCMVIGKGDKEREVYLSARAGLFLKNYLESRSDSNPALFVAGKSPHNRLGYRSFEEIFRELGERAGIKKHVHPHILRHTLATHLINSGVSLAIVQRILGHEDPSTTQIYCQINQEDVQLAHKKSA